MGKSASTAWRSSSLQHQDDTSELLSAEVVEPGQADEPSGRRRVLDAAAALFVTQGYAGTTLRQIAAAAGIKAGSIYHHFASKDALFVAVLDDGINVMIDAFEHTSASLDNALLLADDPNSDPAQVQAERLFAHVRAHLGAVFEHGPYTTAHVTAFFSAPTAIRSQVVPQRDNYERRWHELFERLFPHAEPAELRLWRLILFGAMNATAEWFDVSGDLTLDQLASAISHQFLNGVAQ